MPPPIRILFAEDSETLRQLVTFVFSTDSELEICQTVQNGRDAVDAYQKSKPDVVLMDVEMPVMNGIEATEAIRTLNSHVPIIMFSSLATPDTEATIDALTTGATDFVTKPSTCGHMDSAFEYLRNDLVRKMKCWGRWFQRRQLKSAVTAPLDAPAEYQSCQDATTDSESGSGSKVDVVAIGVSSGGPNALARLLKDIPATFPVPILITQHMPARFTKLLAERLSRICPLRVREAFTGALLEPGQIWIAPGDQHLLTRRQSIGVRLQVHRGPPENSCRPSVDVMFRSIADAYRDRSLAVMLTGMGHDGMLGCRKIKEFGGHVLAQDESSSIVWGMPRAVIKAGLAARTVPLSEMAVELSRLAAYGRESESAARSVAG